VGGEGGSVIHNFTNTETGAVLMYVQDQEYDPGVPGLVFETPVQENGDCGILIDADDIRRLHGILGAWLHTNTGTVL
jgi:hypothetical protein